MANALYDEGRRAFLAGEIDWLGTNMRIILVDAADYTRDLALHDFLDDVAAGAREEESSNLTTKTEADGIADADNVTFSSAAGDPCEQIIGFEETGTDGTSQLIFNIDTASGLPVTLNGGDVTVTWDNGANKIFKL